jgi:hypothetical protein
MDHKQILLQQLQADKSLIETYASESQPHNTSADSALIAEIENDIRLSLELLRSGDSGANPSVDPHSPRDRTHTDNTHSSLPSNDPRVRQFDTNIEHFNSILIHLRHHLEKIETQLRAISQPPPNNKPLDKGILKDAVRSYWIFDVTKKNSFIALDKAADAVHHSAQFILQDTARTQIFNQFSQNYGAITIGKSPLSKAQLIVNIVNNLPQLTRNLDFENILNEQIYQLIKYCETRIQIITTTYNSNSVPNANQRVQFNSPLFGQIIQQDLRILQDALANLEKFRNYYPEPDVHIKHPEVVDNLTKLFQQLSGVDRSDMDAILASSSPIFTHFEELISQGKINQDISLVRQKIVDLYISLLHNFADSQMKMKRTSEYFQILRAVKFTDEQINHRLNRFTPEELSKLQKCAGELQAKYNDARDNLSSHSSSQSQNTSQEKSTLPTPVQSELLTKEQDELIQNCSELLRILNPKREILARFNRTFIQGVKQTPLDMSPDLFTVFFGQAQNYKGSNKTTLMLLTELDDVIQNLIKVESESIQKDVALLYSQYSEWLRLRMYGLIYLYRALRQNEIKNIDSQNFVEIIVTYVAARYQLRSTINRSKHQILVDSFEAELRLIQEFRTEHFSNALPPLKSNNAQSTAPLTLEENAQSGELNKKLDEIQAICAEYLSRSKDIMVRPGADVAQLFDLYPKKLLQAHKLYAELTNFKKFSLTGSLGKKAHDVIELYQKVVNGSADDINNVIVTKLQGKLRKEEYVDYDYNSVLLKISHYLGEYKSLLEQYNNLPGIDRDAKLYISLELRSINRFQTNFEMIAQIKTGFTQEKRRLEPGNDEAQNSANQSEKILATQELKNIQTSLRSQANTDIAEIIGVFKNVIASFKKPEHKPTGLRTTDIGNILNPTIDYIRLDILRILEEKLKIFMGNDKIALSTKKDSAQELLNLIESNRSVFIQSERVILDRIIGEKTSSSVSSDDFKKYIAQLRDFETHSLANFMSFVVLPNWDTLLHQYNFSSPIFSRFTEAQIVSLQGYMRGIAHNRNILLKESTLPIVQKIAQKPKEEIEQVARNLKVYWDLAQKRD